MRLHLDVLGWLHIIWGAFAALAGASLGILALGTYLALDNAGSVGRSELAAIGVYLICGGVLVMFGAVMMLIGRALHRRRPVGRVAALVSSIPNLVIVPFGTALGVYALWALLNDDARREFGRPPRGAGSQDAPQELA
jgi:hypothetical protein